MGIYRKRRLSGTAMQIGGVAEPNVVSYQARRAARVGYPVTVPFSSEEAVRDYLSGDKITCLLCGKQYRSIGSHLRIHAITADDYKIKYNIPISAGLIVEEVSNVMSEQALRPERLEISRKNISHAPRNDGRPPRFVPDYIRKAARKRLVEKALPVRQSTYCTKMTEEEVREYERLIIEERFSKDAAARKVGYAYQTLDYARRQFARRKGLPKPEPLVTAVRRQLPVAGVKRPMTPELVAEIEALAAKEGVTIKQAVRAFGYTSTQPFYSMKNDPEKLQRSAERRAAAMEKKAQRQRQKDADRLARSLQRPPPKMWTPEARKERRNAPLPGYPVQKRFSSHEEVEEYLSDSRITCLRCGRRYKTIGAHLSMVHGMNSDIYRNEYNIPENLSLAAPEMSAKKKATLSTPEK